MAITVLGLTVVAATAQAATISFRTLAGMSPAGTDDGTGGEARFNFPASIAVDSSGALYIADTYNCLIRKMTPAGVVTTFAGDRDCGSADGTGSAARFLMPQGIAVDSADNIYVADSQNHTIRKITPGGVVTTLAGLAGSFGSTNGTGSVARFFSPRGVAVDSAGTVYVGDTANHTIRAVTAAGVVTTLAGLAGSFGTTDGTGSAARFRGPVGMTVDSTGNVYVADTNNSAIRKISAGGVVTTLAGLAGSNGSADGTGGAARFNGPQGVSVDIAGTVSVADTNNSTIRQITSGGVVTTLAGLSGPTGTGNADGTGSAARFNLPWGVAVNSTGTLYVADTTNDTIRRIAAGGVVTTLAGFSASLGAAEGAGHVARFALPNGVAADTSGNVYVTDRNNHTIRKITPWGVVKTFAGLAGSSGSADGTGSAARFNAPRGVAVDGAGMVYLADSLNNTIRTITLAGVVTTLAGTPGVSGSADGAGSAAQFNGPNGVAVDSAGTVYVPDASNHTIRQITVAGVVTTLAGSAGASGSADGTGSAARFNLPRAVAVDNTGTVYVADTSNSTIRKITAGGVVTTLAGLALSGGFNDGTGSAARFSSPQGITVDSTGTVYVADAGASTIRQITAGGVVTTLAGSPGAIGADDGEFTRFNSPLGIAVDTRGFLYVADTRNNTIRTTATPRKPEVGDFDGDGKAEVTLYRPSTGAWYILNSTANYTTFNAVTWGLSTDVPVPADYDGDGKPDIAVYRPSTGQWWVSLSSTNYSTYAAYQWGLSTDVPVPGDYDGDGKAEIAIYRPSTGQWYALLSSSGFTTVGTVTWGTSGDVPVPGDYNGDGFQDIVVYRPSTGQWWNQDTGTTIVWGIANDVPVPADYDGDGKTDIATYRPSTGAWYVLTSTSNYTTYVTRTWGISSDVPVPADYDGDGKTDIAIYRPSAGAWFVLTSASNYTTYVTYSWGTATDVPILQP